MPAPGESLRRSKGEPRAFAGFYDALARDLLVFFVRRTFDVEAARDLTAETFALAFEHRGRWRGSSDAEAAARSVERVSLSYASGLPLVQSGVDGGFVLLADATRPPRQIVAYDRGGRVLERVDVSYISDWGAHCEDPRGCPPGRWERDVGH